VKSLEQELSILLDWLCRHWGFCIPADDRLRIATSGHIEANEFAFAVLLAEGFEQPETETKWMRLLRDRFVEHFGTATVSAEELEETDNTCLSQPD
jgi:hypothetical protein